MRLWEVVKMDKKQLNIIRDGKGFIAVFDQVGEVIPDILERYGISKDEYNTEKEMFNLINEMRTRIITSPGFSSEHIVGVILSEHTMNNKIKGKFTANYLWENKRILSILKIDQGREDKDNGVQLMKPMSNLDELLAEAKKQKIFGIKMHSVIYSANKKGIREIVAQQFEYGKRIYEAGFIPILEPEIKVHSEDKAESEKILKAEIMKKLEGLNQEKFMIRVAVPDKPNFYEEIIKHPNILRVIALLENYSQEEAVNKLAKNDNLLASFSKALLHNLHVNQNDEKFNSVLKEVSEKIYQASISYVLYLHPIATTQLIPITNKL